VGHKFLSTAAGRRRVTDGKKILLFFTFYDFLSVKNMIRAKKKFKIYGVKPILSIYSIYDESKIILLSSYMEYIESIGFTPIFLKNLT
jgi:hypothetical protein